MTWCPEVSGYQTIGAGYCGDEAYHGSCSRIDGERDSDLGYRGARLRHRAQDRVYLLKMRIKGRQRILTIGRHGRGAWGPESARREAIR
jgi:hypothetical protein